MALRRMLAIGFVLASLPAAAFGEVPEVLAPLASTPLLAVLQAPSGAVSTTMIAASSLPAETPRRGPLAGRFLVGATTSIAVTPDVDLGTTWRRISPFIRNTPRRSGWGPSFGLSWYTGDIRVPIDGKNVTIGEVKVRPVMGGVSYGIIRGRAITNLSLVGGYAFNRAKITYALPEGTAVSMSISDAWAVRPNVGLTYALRPRLALVGGVGYVFSKPRISIDIDQPGQPRQTVSGSHRGDYFAASAGLAFSIF
jgi:hypothetical protein